MKQQQQHHTGGEEGGSPNREACRLAIRLVPGVFLLVSRLPQPLQLDSGVPLVLSGWVPGPPHFLTEECCLLLVPPRSWRR